jgi:hypothetical protein
LELFVNTFAFAKKQEAPTKCVTKRDKFLQNF